MAKAKWFPTLRRATPLRMAARRVVASRVRAVRHFLRLTSGRAGEDSEQVHQLRVATRRLGASLAIFKPCLHPAQRRSLRRATRRLRRAAGAVRDLDVQRAMVEKRMKRIAAIPARLARRIRTAMDLELQAARDTLASELPKWRGRFDHAAATVLADLRADGPVGPARAATVGTASRPVLRERLQRLMAAFEADLADLDALHRLRVTAKRLRYAMEVFANCYPAEFRRELYSRVEAIQSQLGDVNDLRNLRLTLTEWTSEEFGDSTRRAAPRSGIAARGERNPTRERGLRYSGSSLALRVRVDFYHGLIDLLVSHVSAELHERQRLFLRQWTKSRRVEFQRRFLSLLAGPTGL